MTDILHTPTVASSASLPGFLLGTPKSPSRVAVPSVDLRYTPTVTHQSGHSPSRFTPLKSCGRDAPPTESLYDSVLIPDKSVLHKTPDRQPRLITPGTPTTPGGVGGRARSRSPARSPGRARSPARRLGTLADESCYEDPLADSWVTVFGFPAASSQFVLQHFALYGKIVKYENPTKGNWLHLMYESKLQARKALSRSGTTINKDVMIGVVPCVDQKAKASVDALNQSIVHTPTRQSRKHEVTNLQPITPYRDEGMVTRAVNYIFGW